MEFLFIWIFVMLAMTIPFVLALISILTKKVATDEKLFWCLVVILAGWLGQVIYFVMGIKQLRELEAKKGAA